METTTVEVWVVVDIDGDSEVYTSRDEADGHGLTGPVRMVRMDVTVPLPKVVQVQVTVAAEPDTATVAVA